jgi:uncharacterized membrane protein YphA (DoxX/SURF4 family)
MISARTILGLIYFVFGLNFFLQFLSTPPPAGGAAESFTTGLFVTGYFFPMLKGLEVILGLALLLGIFVPLALVVLMPISINILLFHVFLTDNAVLSIFMIALQLYLAWIYRDYYKPLLQQRATIH